MSLRHFLAVAVSFLLFNSIAIAQTSCPAPTVNKTVKICAPAAGSTVSSPVQFTASALDTDHRITAMKLYVDNVEKGSASFLANSVTFTASVALAAGTHTAIIRAWDSSGFFFSSTERFTVSAAPPPPPAPTVTISANPAQISSGQNSVLTVTAQNAGPVIISNNVDSSTINMPNTGGTVSVSPTQTTTYKATATSSSGTAATASTTVTVGATGNITAVNHVLFMMQENRSFDSYFGMLNPYRRAHGWNIGSDGQQYDVDGIDDKLNTISNVDDEGDIFKLFHSASSCLDDMSSAWLESYGDVSRWDFTPTRPINMDGFVHTAEGTAKFASGSGSFTDLKGQRAMGYYMDVDFTGANPELTAGSLRFQARRFPTAWRHSRAAPRRAMHGIRAVTTTPRSSMPGLFLSCWMAAESHGRFTMRRMIRMEAPQRYSNTLPTATISSSRILPVCWW